jgi:hypothetical protein
MSRCAVVCLALLATSCICEPGGGACGGQCVDLGSDPRNCGGCDRRCNAPRDLCVSGSCVAGPECDVDADCDDGIVCNGRETCIESAHDCVPGTRMWCDDGIACTRDSCQEPDGRCISRLDDSLCPSDETCVGASAAPSGCAFTCPGGDTGCDPILQCGCEGAEACYPTPENLDGECLPAGSGLDGDACTEDNDCAPTYICLGPPGCRQLCTSDSDCDDGGSCVVELMAGGVTFTVCTDHCSIDPQQGCSGDAACHPAYHVQGESAYADCGILGNTADGDPCASANECRAGSTCVIYGDGSQICTRLCLVGRSSHCAGRCGSFQTPRYVDGLEFGGCF